MKEIKCPSCGGKLVLDKENPNVEFCPQCNKKYTIQWRQSPSTGKEDFELRVIPERIDYQPSQKKERKKTGWEPYGWKRGVALVILFFVLMFIMYGPKVYQRYQMDHGGITVESQEK